MTARAQSTIQEAEAEPAAERARSLFHRGVELSGQERWSEAEDLFRRSYALVPRASTAYNLTIVLLHLKRGAEALDLLSELSRLPDAEVAPFRDTMAPMRMRALALVARLSLALSPSTAELRVDGVVSAGAVDVRELVLEPGRHELLATAAGYRPRTLTVDVEAGAELATSLHLEPVPAPVEVAEETPPERDPTGSKRGRDGGLVATSSSQTRAMTPVAGAQRDGGGSTWPQVTLLAGGGALLAAGAVFGVLALDADAEFVQRCPDVMRCPAERRDELERLRGRAEDYAVAADVLLIGGGIMAAGGLIWLLFGGEHPADDADAARFVPGIASVGMRSSF